MFWGLIIDSNKKYTQTIEKSFHISMASLDISKASNEHVQVSVSYENTSFLLCTLNKQLVLQQPLDLNFELGKKISFSCNGNGRVHLTGYIVEDENDLFDDGLNDDDDEEEEDEVSDVTSVQKKRKAKQEKNGKQKSKKTKLNESVEDDDSDDDEDDEDDDDDDDDLDVEDEDEDSEELDDEDEEDEEEEEEEKVTKKPIKKEVVNGKDVKPIKEEKQKKNKDKKDNSKTEDKNESLQKQQHQKKKVIEGGVQIEEIRLGHGSPAKPGKFVGVYYVGRLKNGKKFDQTMSGEGFKFRLGKGEVIKGWDVGIIGMKVGGKRKITIPAGMGYGAKGSPPVIPPNSQLIFDVELKSVN